MLARCAISTKALTAPEVEPAGIELYHKELTQLLHAHGLVMFGSGAHREQFAAAIQGMTQGREFWISYWAQGINRPSAEPLVATPELPPVEGGDTGGISNLSEWKNVAAVLVTPSEAPSLGCDSGRAMNSDVVPEVVQARYARHSRAFARAADRGAVVRSIFDDADRDAIAREFLVPLIPHTARVSIIDKYLATDLCQHQSDPRRGAVAWLMRMFQEAAALEDTGVDFFTAGDPTTVTVRSKKVRVKLEDQIAWLERILTTSDERRPASLSASEGITELRLFAPTEDAVKTSRAGRRFHDRFLLFESRAAVSLSRGLDVFRGGAEYPSEYDVTYSPMGLLPDAGDDPTSYAVKLKIRDAWEGVARQPAARWIRGDIGWEREV